MPTARLSTWVVQQAVPSFLTEDDDMAHWGNVTYSTAALGANPSCGSSDLEDVRSAFLAEQPLPVGLDDGNGRVGVETVYASAHDFGMVGDSNNTDGDSTSEAMVCYTTGSTQTPTARYLHTGSVAQLAAWWQACYGADLMGLVRCHWHDFAEAGRLAAEVTATLEGDIPRFYEAAGEVEEEPLAELGLPDIPEADALYVITALSARQVMASPPHMFQKELSSDGNVNAVDVVYPAAPFFLWANPEMLRFLLQPAVDMQEADATGHVDGDDKAMPVEEAANMVLLAYAYRRFSGNAAWLVRRVAQLRRFAQHRAAAALVPAVQLSTNDFAGALANQTNLAIKGILALGAMAEVEGVVGKVGGPSGAATAADLERTAAAAYRLVPAGRPALRRPARQPPPLHQERLADVGGCGGQRLPAQHPPPPRHQPRRLAQQHRHRRPVCRPVRDARRRQLPAGAAGYPLPRTAGRRQPLCHPGTGPEPRAGQAGKWHCGDSG